MQTSLIFPPPRCVPWPRQRSVVDWPIWSSGPVELGGRKGPEPVRYGDWEKKGLAVDF